LLKALVIGNEKGELQDVGDVLAVARSLGKQVFKTHKAVYVLRVWFDPELGWVAVVADSLAQAKDKRV